MKKGAPRLRPSPSPKKRARFAGSNGHRRGVPTSRQGIREGIAALGTRLGTPLSTPYLGTPRRPPRSTPGATPLNARKKAARTVGYSASTLPTTVLQVTPTLVEQLGALL